MKPSNPFSIASVLVALLLAFSAQPVSAQSGWNEESKLGPPSGQGDASVGLMILEDAITQRELAPESVTTEELVDGTVTTVDIAPEAVTSDLIEDGAITSVDIQPGTITAANLEPALTESVLLPVGLYTASYELCRLYSEAGVSNNPRDCRIYPSQYRVNTCYGIDQLNAEVHQGQSFTAGATGDIVIVQMHLQAEADSSSPNRIKMAIFDGEGFSGVKLYEQWVTSSYGVGVLSPVESFVLETPVGVVEGNSYTIGLGNEGPGAAGFCGADPGGYADGTAYFGGSGDPHPSRDAAFRVIIQP